MQSNLRFASRGHSQWAWKRFVKTPSELDRHPLPFFHLNFAPMGTPPSLLSNVILIHCILDTFAAVFLKHRHPGGLLIFFPFLNKSIGQS